MDPNATYLFEKPRREFHNAELWWTSFFTLFSFWASSSGYPLVLPTYRYSDGDCLEENGKLSLEKCNYQSTVVDGRLRDDAFGMLARADFVCQAAEERRRRAPIQLERLVSAQPRARADLLSQRRNVRHRRSSMCLRRERARARSRIDRRS